MTRALLDINVLVALLDSDHADHERARGGLQGGIQEGWSTCPITENGFVGIISQPRYPSPVSPAEAIALLRNSCQNGSHEFWSAGISVLDPQVIDRTRLRGPRQVTDAYLLPLATHHDGHFVSFDRSVPLSAVPGARPENLTIL